MIDSLGKLPEYLEQDVALVSIGQIKGFFNGNLGSVIVESSQPDQESLDIGNIICFEDRRVVGMISDVFGPVKQPFYVVVLVNDNNNSEEDSLKAAACESFVGRMCYFVAGKTSFVDKKSVLQRKGCDASNAFDEEIAEDDMEFSDDEAEQERRQRRRNNKRKVTGDVVATTTTTTTTTTADDNDYAFSDYTVLTRPSSSSCSALSYK